MGRFVTHELPGFHCPACLRLSQLSDPYGIDEGSERTCPKCGVVCEVTDIEVIKHATWTVAAEQPERATEPNQRGRR